MQRTQSRNGLGVVILAIVLQSGALVQMWMTAPMVADAVGFLAYWIAFLMTAATVLIVAYILDDEALLGRARAPVARQRDAVLSRRT